MTAVLAMLYLSLFSVLAVGFYAATTTSVQVVNNDKQTSLAMLAAESGMDFIRYHLARVTIPPNAPANSVTAELHADLCERLLDTGNLGNFDIGLSGNVIAIPSNPDQFIDADSEGTSGFRVTITGWPEQGKIVVKSIGKQGNALRAIQMDFTRVPRKTSIFDCAVAAKGQIKMHKNSVTSVDPANAEIATMFSAMEVNPSIWMTGGSIGGNLTIMSDAEFEYDGGCVAGCSNEGQIRSHHLTTLDEPPEFPVFDTEVYKAFATSVSTGANGKQTIKNVRIPANTNPHFNGGATLQGIMYIESPNVVTINGNFNLNGIIVFENKGDTTQNAINCLGTMTQGALPASHEFDAIRAVSGVAILAPTAALYMTGNAKGTFKGNIVTGTFPDLGQSRGDRNRSRHSPRHERVARFGHLRWQERQVHCGRGQQPAQHRHELQPDVSAGTGFL